jgi:glycosyltransferase involved in cell wall biosynthesis
MIRVLQATAWFPPIHLGGTEVYLGSLLTALSERAILSRVVAPLAPEVADGFEQDGVLVRSYSVSPNPTPPPIGGSISDTRFIEILAEEKPDIYHQHSWSRELGAAHLRAAKDLGIPTVLTIHVPNNICLRGTMMRYGKQPCDGRIDAFTCAACWSESRGAPKPLAVALALLPPSTAASVARYTIGRTKTALTAPLLARHRQAEFDEMVANADRIVAVCEWLHDALLINGVPSKKLVLSRQGIDGAFAAKAAQARAFRSAESKSELRVLYLGRWNPVKGVHILVQAIRMIPKDIPLKLTIHAIAKGSEERDYAKKISKMSEGDSRIVIGPQVAREKLPELLSQADVLAVPSLWLETGPLVVLEARAAGLLIIGSRLGGIAELVRDPEMGTLVPAGDPAALADAIVSMALHRKAPTASGDIRKMGDVADEMVSLYQSLLPRRSLNNVERS